MTIYRVILFLAVCFLFSCNSSSEKNFKKACIDFQVSRGGDIVTIDSCFIAPTRDSLDRLLAHIKQSQGEFLEYSTKLLFVIVDTIKKKPDEYQYALVQSDAGVINPDVVLTTDKSIVKERTDKFSPGNIIFQKVVVGQNLKSMTEVIFKTNIRINYRWESNVKVVK